MNIKYSKTSLFEPEVNKEVPDCGKRPVIDEPPSRTVIPRQHWVPRKDAGASTSAQTIDTVNASLKIPEY
jgi:hypothetical protein